MIHGYLKRTWKRLFNPCGLFLLPSTGKILQRVFTLLRAGVQSPMGLGGLGLGFSLGSSYSISIGGNTERLGDF